MSKKLIYPLIVLLCCLGVYLKFHKNQENIPIGCDEFGYLSMSKAFDNKNVFQDHVQRPYMNELLDTLRSASIPEHEIEWMVVPHAYYVVPGSKKIINQYPPGTSYLLSWFPISDRKQLFSALAIFFFLVFPMCFLNKEKKAVWTWFDFALITFVLVMAITAPFLTELTRINSLAFTFGLLIAAGVVLETKPLLSCLLIALSANFRTVNLLMLLPLIAFIPLQIKLSKEAVVNLFVVGFKYIAVTVIAVMPYLLYVYFLLGNPFLPTYSGVDTATTNSGLDNVSYYFNFNQGWFVFHLILVCVFLLLAYFKKIQWTFFFKLLLFPIVNYLFFTFHKVQINYYPYASSFIMLGICFNEFTKQQISTRQNKIIAFLCIAVSVVMFADGLNRYMAKDHKTFEQAKSEYYGLCAYDIVWGDLFPGTAEYVCDNNGFKYGVTSSRTRLKTMAFLHRRNYSQAILLNDNLIEKSVVIKEVTSLGFKFHIVSDEKTGEILVIE